MGKKLLILSQIGSPTKPEPQAVGAYLRRFLMDKRILDIPWFPRFILVNLGIVWRRKKPSAEKYHNIWTPEGSPLVVETTKFTEALKKQLPDMDVVIHWRYGEMDADDTLKPYTANTYEEILVAPLYPQFAMATTGSAFDVLLPAIEKHWPAHKNVKTLKPFFNHEAFLSGWVNRIKPLINTDNHILFSFHGLPVSQLKKTTGCDLETCCDRADNDSRCYYAQCKQTVKLLVERLGLQAQQYTLCFQSRVGPKKWLEPATEQSTENLVKNRNVTSLVVACPAFVTDGLETLEEINIELKQNFNNWGGKHFVMAESLNDNSAWVSGFAGLVNESASWNQNIS